jgi:hypothetical protein
MKKRGFGLMWETKRLEKRLVRHYGKRHPLFASNKKMKKRQSCGKKRDCHRKKIRMKMGE